LQAEQRLIEPVEHRCAAFARLPAQQRRARCEPQLVAGQRDRPRDRSRQRFGLPLPALRLAATVEPPELAAAHPRDEALRPSSSRAKSTIRRAISASTRSPAALP
jgi:hypothetical protein